MLSKRIRSRRTPTRTVFRHLSQTPESYALGRAWRTTRANSHHRAVSYAMPFHYFHWFVTSDIFENRARGTPGDAIPRPTDANNALPVCRTAAGRRVCLSALARSSSSSGGVRADGWQRERRCLVRKERGAERSTRVRCARGMRLRGDDDGEGAEATSGGPGQHYSTA